LVNEMFIMVMNYHMISFTGFVAKPQAQFEMGYSYIVFLFLIAIFNMVFLAVE
jgi:hypothetical protein